MTTITEAEYVEASNDLAGFCDHCKEIVNHGSVEPDACYYVCDECGQKTVFGIEEALLEQRITIG